MSRTLRLLAPALIVTALASVLAIIPTRSDAHVAQQRLSAAEEDLRALNDELADSGVLGLDHDSLEITRRELTAAIPPTHALDELVEHLERAATSHGLRVDDIIPAQLLGPDDDSRVPSGTAAIVVSVAVTGPYSGHTHLLHELSLDERLVMVEAVSIAASTDDSGLVADLELWVLTTQPFPEIVERSTDDVEPEIDGEVDSELELASAAAPRSGGDQ